MPLEPGTTLGPYSVTAKIGEGGMGEVYRARDTTLDRDVAIKVLPDAFASDPKRLARFEREAKVLASLNHPNIGAIYGLETSGDTRALVLELIEGPTLADRIKQGPIPLDEALPIAKQIADALEAAHEAGVIHRDLKPANIKVREDGTVKVLDFGLAKALDPNPTGDPSQSPTLTAAATQMGVIMGTAAYMSPEQVAGKTVDKRSDIWSFGVVLFETLTGQRLFTGETVSHVLARVLDRDLDFEVLPRATPSAVRRLLHRCLRRDRRERVPDIGVARIEINDALTEPATEMAAAVPPLRFWQQPVVATITAITLVAATSLFWTLGSPDSDGSGDDSSAVRTTYTNVALPDDAPLVFVGEATGGLGQTALTLSPDGRTLVYVGQAATTTQLYIRDMGGYEVRAIPDTEGAYAPFFSPDGQWIAFFIGNQLMRVSVEGGRVLPVAEASFSSGGSWSTDDRIAIVTHDGRRFGIVSPTGRDLEQVEVDTSRFFLSVPSWLPNSDWVLLNCFAPLHLCAVSTVSGELRHLRLDGEATAEFDSRLFLAGSDGRLLESGHLIYSAPQDNVVMSVRFDPDRLMVSGDPVVVLGGLRRENAFGSLQLSVNVRGDAVFAPGGNAVLGTFVWADRNGVIEPLPFPPRAYGPFRLSRDGRRVAVKVYPRVGQEELWFLDLERQEERRWVDEGLVGDRELWPGPWLPGTTDLLVGANGPPNLLLRVNGARATGGQPIWSGTGEFWVEDVGIGGHVLIALVRGDQRVRNLSLVALDEFGDLPAEPATVSDPLVASVGAQSLASLSPDMTWLTYSTTESGPYEVRAIRLPPEGAPVRVSDPEGELPRWSPVGDGLYYRDRQRFYWVAYAEGAESPFGVPQLVLEGDFLNIGGPEIEVSPDGTRLLLLQGLGERTQTTLNLVTNWVAELEQLVP